MGRKRSRIEIVFKVLEILIQGESNPTKLATLVNMPYDRLVKLLRELEERKIIEMNSSGKTRFIRITDKGIRLYEELKKVLDLLDDYGLI
ncbi:MAG: winged helix-turn-helix domain-containing protein [Ignisphaera sp.]